MTRVTRTGGRLVNRISRFTVQTEPIYECVTMFATGKTTEKVSNIAEIDIVFFFHFVPPVRRYRPKHILIYLFEYNARLLHD